MRLQHIEISETIWAENNFIERPRRGTQNPVSAPSSHTRVRDRRRTGARDGGQSILRVTTSFFISAARATNFSKTRRIEE